MSWWVVMGRTWSLSIACLPDREERMLIQALSHLTLLVISEPLSLSSYFPC